MKRIALISIIMFAFCISVLPQKLTEPQLLGSAIAGDDLSEFWLHTVMERSKYYLEDNAEGKLIVRICGADDFSTAFVKATYNPLSASRYNEFVNQILVPYEKIYIAKSSKCVMKANFVFTQHWFVPDKNTLEYDEILPINNISYKNFDVDDFDFYKNRYKKTSVEDKEFAENITNFINELKTNPNGQGYIVYNSKNKTIKRNIEKVKARLEKENISLQRVKTVIKVRMDIDKNLKLIPIKDEQRYFPELEILTIKNNLWVKR